MELQKKASFRSAISILCATAMVATLFSGLSLKPIAEESAAEPTTNYEFVDKFDSELNEENWTKGTSITAAKKATAYIPATWNVTQYNEDVLNVTGATGIANFTKNALVKNVASPAGEQLLELVFSGDYDPTDADGIRDQKNIIKGWGTGIVARAVTDNDGNITDGYIIAAKMNNGNDWTQNPDWIRVYKIKDGSRALVGSQQNISSLGGVNQSICKLQVAITDNENGSTTISYNLAKYNTSAKGWTAGISGSVTDSTANYSAGKSGVTLFSETTNVPVVDFYNFSEKVKQVEPSDITAVFDDRANYNMTDWNFGSGITEHAELTDSFADSKQNITPVTKALTLVGTGNKTTCNTMMRNVDSAAGDRELSMVFGENYSYGGVGSGNWHNNSGAGIVTRATVDADGKLTGGYLVTANTTTSVWHSTPGDMCLYKINADGSLSSLKNTSIKTLNGNNSVWNIKMKLYVKVTDKVTDNGSRSTTIDYTIFAYNKDKGWYRSINDKYIDNAPINNPIFAGKSGAVVYSSNSTTPRIQIYEFSDKELIIPSDLTDDFESISADDWKFGSGITSKIITDGYADSTDKAVRITGTADNNAPARADSHDTENTMLRKATSPDGNRFIEAAFDGYYDFSNGENAAIKGWSAGVIANATEDGKGNLTGGYMLMAKMSQNEAYYTSPQSMILWKVNSEGTAEPVLDTMINLSELGYAGKMKFKLQLSVIAGENSTTLKYALLTLNNAGEWVEKYTGSYTDNVKTVSGKSGVAVKSGTEIAPIVDVYSFKDVTPVAPKIDTNDSMSNVTMEDEYAEKVVLAEEVPNALKFTVTKGDLPTGLFLNELTGDIVGIPLIDGEFSVVIKVEDTFGNSDTHSYSFTVSPTDELVFIEIRKKLLGFEDINDFRIIDQNADNEIDICDLVAIYERAKG